MEVSFFELVNLLRGDFGWLFFSLLTAYELFWPFWVTKIQNKIDNITKDVYSDVGEIKDNLDNLDEKVTHHIQVTRAMSRKMEGIDDERVDDYLVKNGVEVDEFIKDE